MPPDFFDIPIFEVVKPAQLRVPYLFNSPHSGRIYPLDFMKQSKLDIEKIRMSEDAFVDLLFCDVVAMGAAFMQANFPRAFLDVNRKPFELDQAYFCDALPDFIQPPSVRAKAGFGTVPSRVAFNKNLYEKPLSFTVVQERITQFYFPYHKVLQAELDRIKKTFGFVTLIDCHSMPSNLKFFEGKKQPDIILGDCHGRACAPELLYRATESFCEKGYHVVHNLPYSGGYITEHYGAPEHNCHALQIEINRELYMNERQLKLHTGFEQLHTDVIVVCADLMSLPDNYFITYKNSAE